ncbi:hypothetical protein SRB5_42120 [Streptomyces sp. RB5]|uniref:Pyridoxamine 5'-phosphate oxidase N-terminal domain-containing protein n=1 Tax=Streptomyces smaragdinus TaxID=2585196 RepID=A0A7K0CKW1_9ACTN|nr:pyridoxamine 5'-phosphate oxidase family protein [Streptomyces smaragdinus]MQY14051.1 hypothetical protein [Streptomyces smaragdinus]
MTDPEPVETTNLDRYGNAPLPWSRALERLGSDLVHVSTTTFLATAGKDGRPHSAGIGSLWLDGDLFFTSGPHTRKSRNLAVNPACAVSFGLEGLDLVLEGSAARVTTARTLEKVAESYREGGWPVAVADDALTAPYSAPSAGPPPWYVYRLSFDTAVGVATAAPHGAMRWRFAH